MITTNLEYNGIPESVKEFLKKDFEEREKLSFANRLSLFKAYVKTYPVAVKWKFTGSAKSTKNEPLTPYVDARVPINLSLLASEFGLIINEEVLEQFVYSNLSLKPSGELFEGPANVCLYKLTTIDAVEKDPAKRLSEVKIDGGYESNVSGFKGMLSDAKKRVSAKLGIALQVYEFPKVFAGSNADFKKRYLAQIGAKVTELFNIGDIDVCDVVRVFTTEDYFELYVSEDAGVVYKNEMQFMGRYDKKGNDITPNKEEPQQQAAPALPAKQAAPKLPIAPTISEAGVQWVGSEMNSKIKAVLDETKAGAIVQFSSLSPDVQEKAVSGSINTLGVWRLAAYENKHGSRYYLASEKSNGAASICSLDMGVFEQMLQRAQGMKYRNA